MHSDLFTLTFERVSTVYAIHIPQNWLVCIMPECFSDFMLFLKLKTNHYV